MRSVNLSRTAWVVVLVAVAVVATACLRGTQPQAGGVWTGNAQDFEVKAFDGRKFNVAAKYAGRPLVLNFWAVWCPPCVGEFPEFQKVYNKHKGQFAMLSVAVNAKSDPAAFVKQNGYNWDFALDTDGSKRYSVDAIPRTLFVTPTGDIVADQRGGMTEAQFEGYLAQLLAH
jgi:thiol-disulfide isomerase/thioredoxin